MPVADHRLRGFSLVEIVLALGILSFALVAIFGLVGQALRSNTETISQHEVVGLSRGLADFLRSTNGGAGFSKTFDWVKTPSSQPEIYGFASSNGIVTNALGSTPGLTILAAGRSSRLFRYALAFRRTCPD